MRYITIHELISYMSVNVLPSFFGITVIILKDHHNYIDDDVTKWKHFPRYWPFMRGDPPVTGGFPSQRPVTWSFYVFFDLSLNKRWGNNRDSGDLRRHRDITVMWLRIAGYYKQTLFLLRSLTYWDWIRRFVSFLRHYCMKRVQWIRALKWITLDKFHSINWGNICT